MEESCQQDSFTKKALLLVQKIDEQVNLGQSLAFAVDFTLGEANLSDFVWLVVTISGLWQSMKYNIAFKLSIEIIMANLKLCHDKIQSKCPKFISRVLPWLQKAVEVTMKTKYYDQMAISQRQTIFNSYQNQPLSDHHGLDRFSATME